MSRKFNPSRPHGEVIGGAGRERFHQDGIYYDANGDEVSGTYVEPTDAEHLLQTKDETIAKLQADLAESRAAEAANSERGLVIAALEAGGIEFDKRLGTDKLAKILEDSKQDPAQ